MNLCLLVRLVLTSRTASCTSHIPYAGNRRFPGFGHSRSIPEVDHFRELQRQIHMRMISLASRTNRDSIGLASRLVSCGMFMNFRS